MNKVPCFKCTERTDTCHVACPKYLSYRALIDKELPAKDKNRQLRADMVGMTNHLKAYMNRKSNINTRKKGLKDG